MTEFGAMQLVYLVGWLVLAGSALAVYRLNWKRGLLYLLMWGSIFAAVFLVFSLMQGR